MTTFLPPYWVHNNDGTTTQRGGPPGSYQGRCDSNFRPIRDSQKLNAKERMELRREDRPYRLRCQELEKQVESLRRELTKCQMANKEFGNWDERIEKITELVSALEFRLARLEQVIQ